VSTVSEAISSIFGSFNGLDVDDVVGVFAGGRPRFFGTGEMEDEIPAALLACTGLELEAELTASFLLDGGAVSSRVGESLNWIGHCFRCISILDYLFYWCFDRLRLFTG